MKDAEKLRELAQQMRADLALGLRQYSPAAYIVEYIATLEAAADEVDNELAKARAEALANFTDFTEAADELATLRAQVGELTLGEKMLSADFDELAADKNALLAERDEALATLARYRAAHGVIREALVDFRDQVDAAVDDVVDELDVVEYLEDPAPDVDRPTFELRDLVEYVARTCDDGPHEAEALASWVALYVSARVEAWQLRLNGEIGKAELIEQVCERRLAAAKARGVV